MLPPASTAQTGPSPGTRPRSSAATGAAPAPSTTSFERSSSSTIACEIASSSTTTTSSRRSRRIAEVSSAGYLTAMPSAIVGPVGALPGERRARRGLNADERELGPQRPQPDRDPRREPAAADRDHHRPRPGRQLLGELEPQRPLARRPPAGRRRRGRRSRPSARRGARAAATASSKPSPPSTTVAPYPRAASTLAIGAPSGTKIVAAIPAWRAAHATAWPWLPALAVTTPASPLGSVSCAIVL